MKLISIVILSVFFLIEPIEPKLELEDFVFSQEDLPLGCTLKTVGSNDRLPCEIKTNPFISEDPSFLDCFTKRLIQDKTLNRNITKGLFSVYEGPSEIGVFGLETASEKTTTLIHQHIKANNSSDASMELIQAGKILIWLWHDRERTNSFTELRKLIEAEIN